jgi:hypothetical protein
MVESMADPNIKSQFTKTFMTPNVGLGGKQ